MSDSTTYSIYRIVCFATGKCYVGQTCNIKRRKSEHFCDLKNGEHHNQHLQKAFNKYGRGQFYFEIIESSVNQDTVNQREIYWIQYFDSYSSGYNLTQGGDSSSRIAKSRFFNGIWYGSVEEVAKANNVDRTTIFEWLKKGYTSTDQVKRRLNKTCKWNGEVFRSINSAAKSIGVSAATMQRYIDSGYQYDSDLPSGRTSSKLCIWNGISYLSVSEAANANGIKQQTLSMRIKQGHSSDSDVVNAVAPIETFWNNQRFTSRKLAALSNSIPYNKFLRYLR